VVDAVKKDGWAVLNADNAHCVKVGRHTQHCHVTYFSMDENNPVIQEHCKAGGIAAVYENGYITIRKGDWKIRVEKVTHIPITFGGTVNFMTQNALAATLATFLWGFKIEDIRLSLETFIPSAAHTPGRMNIFNFREFKVLVDHAHNPAGLNGVKDFLSTIDAQKFTGIIAGTGDRRDDDIREMGRISAQMFDEVIICQERYLRGRTADNIVQLLKEGLNEVKPGIPIEVISSGKDALKFAIDHVKPGEYIAIVSDAVADGVRAVQSYQDKEAGL
jgi:cyanophycin synthetase